MPMIPLRPCAVAGCPRPAIAGSSRCTEHALQQQRERDANRPSAATRGYDARWRRRRAAYLRQHPWCVQCGAPSRVVDHVIPRRRGGADDESNWQALCATCHNAKTMRQSVGKGR